MIDFIANCFGYLMNLIYSICNNYGITILIFTFITKIILFPVNILVHKNSIKMVKMKPKIDELKIKYNNDKDAFMEAQIDLFEKEKYHPSLGTIPLIIQIPIILGLVYVVKNPSQYIEGLNSIYLFFINLSLKPSTNNFYIIPIIAVFATILLWFIENRINVLQREASLWNKLFTGIITVGITTYLVFIVPNGVGLYWIFSDIFAVLQICVLNTIFPPKKYVDYEYLNRIKKEKEEQLKFNKESKKKSKYYYKKFFETDNIDNMKLMFYSEGSGYYKYFKGIIEYILDNSNINIHYVTSDMNDKIFEKNNPRVIPYYIAINQLIPLFMKLEADIVVMTTPDLENLYLKRSIVRKDIEYIYTDHAITSINLMYRNGALDYFDTIFVTGQNQVDEIRKIEKIRNTKEKNIVKTGYCLLDDMVKNYVPKKSSGIKNILIAPSWQNENIMDLCIDKVLDALLGNDYLVTLRPHPQYMRTKSSELDRIAKKYNEKGREDFVIQRDFSSNEEVLNADVIITDWSGIGFEYAFVTNKPVVYINTPMKVINKEYKKVDITPIHVELRDVIGKSINIDDIDASLKNIIGDMTNNTEKWKEKILCAREKYLFNFGKCSKVAGDYIIKRVEESN